MIARAGVRIDAESLTHHPLALLDGLLHERTHASLSIQLALPFRDDHFGTLERGRQRLAQHPERLLHVIGMGAADPPDPYAANRIGDRVVALAMRVGGAR